MYGTHVGAVGSARAMTLTLVVEVKEADYEKLKNLINLEHLLKCAVEDRIVKLLGS